MHEGCSMLPRKLFCSFLLALSYHSRRDVGALCSDMFIAQTHTGPRYNISFPIFEGEAGDILVYLNSCVFFI